MLKVRNITKQYGNFTALKDVSFEIKPGEIIGLLGPNGAGKTTLIKILTGYFEPSAGSLEIGGYDALKAREKINNLIGYLPENAPLYGELNVQESLVLAAKIHGLFGAHLKERLTYVVEKTALWEMLTRPVGQLSKGYRQRVGLAAAIIAEPRFLILDEPTNGLDPTQISTLLHFIKELAENCTVLLSTHILQQVEEVAERALILMGGELKADLSLYDLAQENTFNMLLDSASFSADDLQKCKNILENIKEFSVTFSETAADGGWHIRAAAPADCPLGEKLYNLARQNDWPLRELYRERPSLEAVFREKLIGRSAL